MKNIAILVLAAGKSSRMNSIKQLKKINKKTLLDITLEKAIDLSANHVYCVLGANADEIKMNIETKNIQFIYNQNFEKGLSSSIVSGVSYLKNKECNFDGILILLADQPAIEITYLKAMFNLFEKNKIIASNYDGKLGVPALFPKKYFNELVLIKGDKGAKKIINQYKKEVISLKKSTNFIDIDTEMDLESYNKSIYLY